MNQPVEVAEAKDRIDALLDEIERRVGEVRAVLAELKEGADTNE